MLRRAAQATLTCALVGALAGCGGGVPNRPSSVSVSAGATASGSPKASAGSTPREDGENEAAPPTGEERTATPTPSADPSALPIPTAPRTTPNLGSASLLQPVTSVVEPPASPVLKKGFSGAKVYLIQKKFGTLKQIGTLDATTQQKVREWQSEHGLKVTGEVNKATWESMFPDIPWTIDRFQVKPTLPLDASANARIEAMIAFIRSEIGAPYVWGSAGPKKYGYDCSGLLLQAMYYAGLDPQPLNVVEHQGLNYPTARKLYDYEGFKRVPVAEAKRGDFVFYGPPGRITHVVLWLDDGYVLEALPTRGVSEDKAYTTWNNHGNTYTKKEFAVRVTQ